MVTTEICYGGGDWHAIWPQISEWAGQKLLAWRELDGQSQDAGFISITEPAQMGPHAV